MREVIWRVLGILGEGIIGVLRRAADSGLRVSRVDLSGSSE
jgi:hypothetical protein